jgi:EthD domain
MIHQFIVGAPKPGWTAEEFQDYWLNVHAVKYASKIPQIKRYLIDSRIPFEGDFGDPQLPHQGIAEIWLENEQEQLASLESDEFLNGARLDEPNWAAFWSTIVLDTTAYEVLSGPAPTSKHPEWIKLTVLLKRKSGMELGEYRQRMGSYSALAGTLPGLRRYLQCHTRDTFYVFGEAAFDSIEQLWFDDAEAVRAVLASPSFTERVRPTLDQLVDPKYVFSMLTREDWVIGPEIK